MVKFIELAEISRERERREMSEANEERRLAAIMFTDIVGYTAITQENESVALALLKDHAAMLRPLFFQSTEGERSR